MGNRSMMAFLHFRDVHMDSLSKATYSITESLIYAVNATRSIVIVPTWGYNDTKTGKLTGMVGDLLYGRAHLGGTSMFFTTDRLALIDFVSMTTNTFTAFVFRPPSLSYTSNIYFLPLSPAVWIGGCLLVMSCVTVIFFTQRFSANSVASMNFKTDSMRSSDFLLIAVSTVCQMSTQLFPKRWSGRVCIVSITKYFH